MVTSRTGTANWKRVQRTVIAEALHRGITGCPLCHLPLHYVPRSLEHYNPRRAEVDHILSVEDGGQDTVENARVICADCNKRRRSKRRNRANQPDGWPVPLHSDIW